MSGRGRVSVRARSFRIAMRRVCQVKYFTPLPQDALRRRRLSRLDTRHRRALLHNEKRLRACTHWNPIVSHVYICIYIPTTSYTQSINGDRDVAIATKPCRAQAHSRDSSTLQWSGEGRMRGGWHVRWVRRRVLLLSIGRNCAAATMVIETAAVQIHATYFTIIAHRHCVFHNRIASLKYHWRACWGSTRLRFVG